MDMARRCPPLFQQRQARAHSLQLLPPPPPPPRSWGTAPRLPSPLAEVAAGWVDTQAGPQLVVVGQGDGSTFVYDPVKRKWSTGEDRPYPGNHHASEVVGGKLYLFGGLKSGGTKVQVRQRLRSLGEPPKTAGGRWWWWR